MPVITNTDEIANLNILIKEHLDDYLEGMGVELNFAAPDPGKLPTVTTLHLFLYLIHEDLELRHGDAPRYLPEKQSFEPRSANVRCLYLVTYWEPDSGVGNDSPYAEPDSDAVKILNRVTKALLSMRIHPALQHCVVRIIEPEALNSLGNFWQALGDKPKTIVNFSVTLPVSFEKSIRVAPMVASIDSQLTHGSNSWQLLLEHYLLNNLRQALPDNIDALDKLVVLVTRISEEHGDAVVKADIKVTGLAWKSVAVRLESLIAAWQGTTVTVSKVPIQMTRVEHAIIQVDEVNLPPAAQQLSSLTPKST